MEKMIKIGVMPGRIQEVVCENGATIRELLVISDLDSTGYEIKVDGSVVSLDHQIGDNDNLVLLVKQIKGNAGVIKVGIMPGRIQEVAFTDGMSINDVLEVAGLDKAGYEIKVDGNVVNGDYQIDERDNLILLVKQIKGNK